MGVKLGTAKLHRGGSEPPWMTGISALPGVGIETRGTQVFCMAWRSHGYIVAVYPTRMLRSRLLLIVVVAWWCTALAQPKTAYKYVRAGNGEGRTVASRAGYALMGGGTDLDEAFRWLCERAAGGDFLVLRASGDEDYNPYIQKLCALNSVATLVLPNREAALDPFVAKTIREAAGIFIAGGDRRSTSTSGKGRLWRPS